MGGRVVGPWMISGSVMAAQRGIAALLGEMRRPAMALASYTVKLGGLGGGSGDTPAPAPTGGSSLAGEGPEEFLPLTTLGSMRRFGRRPQSMKLRARMLGTVSLAL